MSESPGGSGNDAQTPWLFPGEWRPPQAPQLQAEADENLQLELSLRVPRVEEPRAEMATAVPQLESPPPGVGSPPHSSGIPRPEFQALRVSASMASPPETSLALAPPGAAWAPDRNPFRGAGARPPGGGAVGGGGGPRPRTSPERFLDLNLTGPSRNPQASQPSGSSDSGDGGGRGGGDDMAVYQRSRSREGASAERREAPYPWALERPCKIHSMEWMTREGITRIWGDVRCKKCGVQTRQEVSLEEGYNDVRDALEQRDWQGRAPKFLLKPRLLDCPACNRAGNSSPNRYDDPFFNNWLFMVLTQTLGICTLQELRYFCQKNNLHSSGSKAVVLDKAFESIVAQLEGQAPEGE